MDIDVDFAVVGGKFQISKKIRVKSSSEVYEGYDITSKERVAIKREHVKTKQSRLLNEIEMYSRLKEGVGIPTLKWHGEEGGYRYLVIEFLGPSLEDLLQICGGQFSLKTVLMLGLQIIDAFRYIHSKGVIYRDLKPGHLLMGQGCNMDKVYLIDFGLATSYRNPTSSEHIPYREGADFVGTRLFASNYTHCRIEQSRRDDAESLCYVLMYLLKGSLPWQKLSQESNNEKKDDEIMNLKYWYTKPEKLREEYSKEFEECMHYARYVTFYCTPALLSMKISLTKLFNREGFNLDHMYDWFLLKQDESVDKTTAQDSLSDDHFRNMIFDYLSSAKDVSIDSGVKTDG